MLMDWTKQEMTSLASHTAQNMGSRMLPTGPLAAQHLLAQNEWAQCQLTGSFSLSERMRAVLNADEKLKKVYCVIAISTSAAVPSLRFRFQK